MHHNHFPGSPEAGGGNTPSPWQQGSHHVGPNSFHQHPPQHGNSPNPWNQYYEQQRHLIDGQVRKKKRKTQLWASLAALPLGFILVFVTVTIINKSPESSSSAANSIGEQDLGSGSPTDPYRYWVNIPAGPIKNYSTDIPGLTVGPSPDEKELASIDPRNLYWAMLKRQGTKTVTDFVNVSWGTPTEYRSRFPEGTARHTGVNYQTRQFILESTDIGKDGLATRRLGLQRCIDGGTEASYNFENKVFNRPAEWKPSSSPGFCDERMKQPGFPVANVYISDGIAPGGLSPEEMDKFISYIDQIPNFFNVEKPVKVTDKNGKARIQLDVKIIQQDAKMADSGIKSRTGLGILNAAFAQTGKSPHDYPYSVDFSDIAGKQIRYFIDPETLLPTHSIMMTLKPLNLDGSPKAIEPGEFPNKYIAYQYGFPGELDAAARKAEGDPTIEFRWPFDLITFQ